jgi:hypothetical protein
MRLIKSNFLFFGIILLAFMIFPFTGSAAVNKCRNFFLLRCVSDSIPPPVFLSYPEQYVYTIPDIAVEILFHQGYWYRPYEGRWYRAKSYNGPWVYIDPPKVPRALFDLPPDYRWVPPGHRKIPYGQLKKNWGKWERERYWERDERWREGRHRGPGDREGFGPGAPIGKHDGPPPKPEFDFDKGKKGHPGKGHK